LISLSVCLLLNLPALSQQKPERELQAVRQEITKYEKELEQARSRETATSHLITSLDRDIDLTIRYIRNLSHEIGDLTQQINQYDRDIKRLHDEIERLRVYIKKRMVQFYKYERSQRYALCSIRFRMPG
jgi:peptidoglycan hydrolase CwlO-like protein